MSRVEWKAPTEGPGNRNRKTHAIYPEDTAVRFLLLLLLFFFFSLPSCTIWFSQFLLVLGSDNPEVHGRYLAYLPSQGLCGTEEL